jgi:hypothetical protein
VVEAPTSTEAARARWLGVATVHAVHQAAQLAGRSDVFPMWLVALHVLTLPVAVVRPRLAMAAVAMLGIVQCAAMFPVTATHLYLGVVVSLLLGLLDPEDPLDVAQLRKSALALPLIVFAWSGLQKAIHGYWFSGELLAWTMVARDDVAWVVRPLLDDGTAVHLGALKRDVEGSGPFRLQGLWALASNGVWLAELGSPLLALWARLRAQLWAWLLLGTWMIQLVAHEWQFALLFTNLLLCAAPPKAQRVGRALTLAGLGLLLFAHLTGTGMLRQVTS